MFRLADLEHTVPVGDASNLFRHSLLKLMLNIHSTLVMGRLGRFENNLMTFNPTDARTIQTAVKQAGYSLEKEADEGSGPTHFTMKDPDGNVILVDQH